MADAPSTAADARLEDESDIEAPLWIPPPPDDTRSRWVDLTAVLIAELAMDPVAARQAAAAELGIPYG